MSKFLDWMKWMYDTKSYQKIHYLNWLDKNRVCIDKQLLCIQTDDIDENLAGTLSSDGFHYANKSNKSDPVFIKNKEDFCMYDVKGLNLSVQVYVIVCDLLNVIYERKAQHGTWIITDDFSVKPHPVRDEIDHEYFYEKYHSDEMRETLNKCGIIVSFLKAMKAEAEDKLPDKLPCF